MSELFINFFNFFYNVSQALLAYGQIVIYSFIIILHYKLCLLMDKESFIHLLYCITSFACLWTKVIYYNVLQAAFAYRYRVIYLFIYYNVNNPCLLMDKETTHLSMPFVHYNGWQAMLALWATCNQLHYLEISSTFKNHIPPIICNYIDDRNVTHLVIRLPYTHVHCLICLTALP